METTALRIAIVGAGAAGLAAAHRAIELGFSVNLLEATDRIGGRAHTVSMANGDRVDLGAHWLHQAPINPLIAEADDRDAIQTRPWRPAEGIWVNGAWLSDIDLTDIENEMDAIEQLGRELTETTEDAAISDLIDPMFLMRSPLESALSWRLGSSPLSRSAVDYARWGRQDGSWPVATGLGDLLEAVYGAIPVRLQTPVHTIDWSSELLRIDLGDEVLEADTVIVTSSPAVLQSGAIHFAPDLPPDHAEAIAAFAMSDQSRIALTVSDIPSQFGSERVLLTTRDRLPIAFELPVAGGHTVVATILAEGRSLDELISLVRERLTEVFSLDADAISEIRAIVWADDPWTGGATAVIPPDRAQLRDVLGQPVAGRIWFAGEATSAISSGTVNGAIDSGIRAVNELAVAHGAIPEMPRSRDTSRVFRFDF